MQEWKKQGTEIVESKEGNKPLVGVIYARTHEMGGGGGGVLHALTRFLRRAQMRRMGSLRRLGTAVSDVGTIDPIDAPVTASGWSLTRRQAGPLGSCFLQILPHAKRRDPLRRQDRKCVVDPINHCRQVALIVQESGSYSVTIRVAKDAY